MGCSDIPATPELDSLVPLSRLNEGHWLLEGVCQCLPACAEDKERYERELQDNPAAQRKRDKGKAAKALPPPPARVRNPRTKARPRPTRADSAVGPCSAVRRGWGRLHWVVASQALRMEIFASCCKLLL